MVVFEDDAFVTEVIDALPPANGVAEVVAEDGVQCHVNVFLLPVWCRPAGLVLQG